MGFFDGQKPQLGRRKKKKWWQYLDLIFALLFALDVVRRNVQGSGGHGYGQMVGPFILLGLAAVALISALPFLRQRGKTAKELGSEEQESLARYLDPDKKTGG